MILLCLLAQILSKGREQLISEQPLAFSLPPAHCLQLPRCWAHHNWGAHLPICRHCAGPSVSVQSPLQSSGLRAQAERFPGMGFGVLGCVQNSETCICIGALLWKIEQKSNRAFACGKVTVKGKRHWYEALPQAVFVALSDDTAWVIRTNGDLYLQTGKYSKGSGNTPAANSKYPHTVWAEFRAQESGSHERVCRMLPHTQSLVLAAVEVTGSPTLVSVALLYPHKQTGSDPKH